MIHFHFKTYGDKTKQPLLMLHGFMGESSDFDSLAEKLQENFFCIALDLPGHGETRCDEDDDYTIEKTSEAINKFLMSEKIKSPHLYGYSMGGRVVFYLLTHYSESFSKSIVESSSPGLKTESEKIERQQKDLLLSKRMTMQPMVEFLEDWYNLELFSSIDKTSDAFQNMIVQKSKNNISKLALSLKHLGTGAMPSLWDSLDKIQTDVLLITGSLDKKYKSIAHEISDKHENFSYEIIDDASHNVHFEQEEQIYKIVINYLK